MDEIRHLIIHRCTIWALHPLTYWVDCPCGWNRDYPTEQEAQQAAKAHEGSGR